MLALLAENPTQPLDIGVVELAIAGRGAFGIEQSLTLEEADLRDGDVGELFFQQGQHLSDREIGPVDQGARPQPCADEPKNTSLNLPICNSSPLPIEASSIRSRLRYVPLSDPTSRTRYPLSSRTISACRRDTVMSSRKISLLGWRPARVTDASSRNFDPALGPRFTTSIPVPSGSSSRVTVSSSSVISPVLSTAIRRIVVSSPAGSKTAPHEEQKLAPCGLRCPHWWQNTRRKATQSVIRRR